MFPKAKGHELMLLYRAFRLSVSALNLIDHSFKKWVSEQFYIQCFTTRKSLRGGHFVKQLKGFLGCAVCSTAVWFIGSMWPAVCCTEVTAVSPAIRRRM